MKTIYFPNLYRLDEHRNNEMNTEINYAQKKLKGEAYQAFRIGITYRLIEQLLYYDRVYVDFIDLPDLLICLEYIDVDFLKEVSEKGYISFVNGHDISVGVSRNGKYFGTLAYGMSEYGRISTLEELREFVFFRYNYNKNIDDILKYLMSTSIEYNQKDFVDVVNSLNEDIKDSSIRKSLGLNSVDGTKIIRSDVPTINGLGHIYKGLKVVRELNLSYFYTEDIILDIYEARFNKLYSNDAFKFNQLIKTYKLPDIELLMFYNKLNTSDILKIKTSKDFRFIYERVINETECDHEVLNVLLKATNNRIKKTDYVFKALNLMTSAIVGILNPFAGIGSALTGEIISIIKDSKNHPTLALEQISDMIREKSGEIDSLPQVVSTRMKKHYIIK